MVCSIQPSLRCTERNRRFWLNKNSSFLREPKIGPVTPCESSLAGKTVGVANQALFRYRALERDALPFVRRRRRTTAPHHRADHGGMRSGSPGQVNTAKNEHCKWRATQNKTAELSLIPSGQAMPDSSRSLYRPVRIFSSAEQRLRVARRMSFTICADIVARLSDFYPISASLQG